MSIIVDDRGVSFQEIYQSVEKKAYYQKLITLVSIGAILLYFVFSIIQFDLGSISRKWSPERASRLFLDTYAHKDHVVMNWKDTSKISVNFEGDYRYQYPSFPEWLERIGDGKDIAILTFNSGSKAIFRDDKIIFEQSKSEDRKFIFGIGDNGKPYAEAYDNDGNEKDLPNWIRVTESKVEVRPSLYERIQIYKRKVEVHRYEFGWKYFWFDFFSPLKDYSLPEALSLIFSNERIEPDKTNFELVFSEISDNEQWMHGTVLFSILETLLMAVLGTLLASLLGLPLAFLAAYNITPFKFIRFSLRRLFDMLRGIDMIIWCLIFVRSFGPGLFTGIFAIAFTDTGTLGKLMSEAIENADNKQQEGVKSTGASTILQHRFGIIPQIMPVFISQSLYYLESNTRGAVILGAMGAGGIGLQLLGAIRTGNDFENVGYMAVLIVLLVTVMDQMSAFLRRFLIGIEKN